ncbi:MAG: hypothetical protein HYW49_01985 [Deltaproteobacteria bacterium]|nr:hypothetical protein [Deltaproteobacteria bacterium]
MTIENLSDFELTLYFYPSPYGIDWSSPRGLARSAVLNQFSRDGRSIGHVHIELKAPDGSGTSPLHLVTGMIQRSHTEERALLFSEKVGLGILFHDFQGAIEQTESAAAEIKRHCRKGTISFLKFLIGARTHARALSYLREFIERGDCAHYGLPNRPLHGEGGGCTAFSTSFLEITGLMEEEFLRDWTQRIRVPRSLLGGTYADPEFFGEHSPRTPKEKNLARAAGVSLARLLLPFGTSRWAGENEAHREVFFWDPDRMHGWVQRVWHEESTSPTGRFRLETREKARGLVADRRGLHAPEGPLWKNRR